MTLVSCQSENHFNILSLWTMFVGKYNFYIFKQDY